MKIYMWLFLCVIFGGSLVFAESEEAIVFGISNEEVGIEPMKIYVGMVALLATQHKKIEVFLEDVRQKLSFGSRFSVCAEIRTSLPKKKSQIRELFERGFDAALLISISEDDSNSVDWRLYDTDGGTMVQGRKLLCSSLRDTAAQIAVRVIEALVAQVPPFLTKIAFVERKAREKGSILWLTDVQGQEHTVLYDSSRILVSPSWGKPAPRQFIAISEFTPHNVRFVGIDMHGRRYRLLDRDGTSVGICYDQESDRVVYAHSGAIWQLQFNGATNLWEHRCIPGITGTCGTPVLGPGGGVFYCSNGNICFYDVKKMASEMITSKGYHVAPTYSTQGNRLVFASKDKETMQLQEFDLVRRTLRPITQGVGIKTDPTLSPCGRYCGYCFQVGCSSVIRVRDLLTGEDWQVSQPGVYAQFPSWSPYLQSTDIAHG